MLRLLNPDVPNACDDNGGPTGPHGRQCRFCTCQAGPQTSWPSAEDCLGQDTIPLLFFFQIDLNWKERKKMTFDTDLPLSTEIKSKWILHLNVKSRKNHRGKMKSDC